MNECEEKPLNSMSKQFVIYEILFMSHNQFVCESIVESRLFEVSEEALPTNDDRVYEFIKTFSQ
jgi:hypothetical protein